MNGTNKKVFRLALRFDLHSELKPYIEPELHICSPEASINLSRFLIKKDFQLGLLVHFFQTFGEDICYFQSGIHG